MQMWEIRWTDEFAQWIISDVVDAAAREDIRAGLLVLRAKPGKTHGRHSQGKQTRKYEGAARSEQRKTIPDLFMHSIRRDVPFCSSVATSKATSDSIRFMSRLQTSFLTLI